MPTTIRRRVALAAMIFAVAMTFIDQTIVSVAAPRIQSELGLSSAGVQWAVNAYLLAMAALFAFGGRLVDTMGRRRMVVVGTSVFAVASALCGLTPTGRLAEPWLVTFRAVQGAGAALMYPAALAVVVGAYEAGRRGRALALFFGIAGGLTAVGPTVGGYLTAWTWRSIFWINIPIAVIALALVARSGLTDERRPARLDVAGLALITPGVGLVVVGLQQAGNWGWTSPLTVVAIVAGLALLGAFVAVERRAEVPLVDLALVRNRAFGVDNVVLFAAMIVFVPIFFFASEYGQIALGRTPARASLLLLYFFAGFVVAAQFGGRMLDRVGARRPIVVGAILTAVGLRLWAAHVTTLAIGSQVPFIVLTGTGLGLLLGQANTDALNHAPESAYGEATGIIQTVRNAGSSLGLAVLGSVLTTQLQAHLAGSLAAQGVPAPEAHTLAATIARLGHASTGVVPHFVRLDFARATGSVLTVMSWVMIAAAVVAVLGLSRRTAPRSVHSGSEPTRTAPRPSTAVTAPAMR